MAGTTNDPRSDEERSRRAFKDALSAWATGVSVVTTRVGDLVHGVTVSSFTSVSLDPPLVLACLGSGSRALAMVLEARGFAVSMLASDQQAASAYFASATRAPAASFPDCDIEWVSGLPAIDGALAVLGCGLHASYRQGDHTIVIGEVLESRHRADKQPLLYHRRGYRALANPEATSL